MSIDEEVLRKSVDVWGIKAQMQLAQVALSELVAAVGYYLLDPGIETMEAMLDGIADAEIIIGQLEVIVGAEKVAEKIERLRARLEKAL